MPLEPAAPSEPVLSMQSADLTIKGLRRKISFFRISSETTIGRIFLYAFLFLLQLSFFGFLACHRLIDSDEGFYLYISKIIMAQKALPYRDVFYQQMPLLPYLYGLWMGLFGFTWESGRIFSAVITALAGLLLFHSVLRTTRSFLFSAVSLLLFALNLSVLLFFLTAKTYALSTTFLFAALLMATSVNSRFSGFLGGLFFSLSVQTRLYFVAAAPAFAFVLGTKEREKGLRTFRNFVLGNVAGFIPSFILFLHAPRQFVFDNILYHGIRDRAGLIGDLEQKLQIAHKLILSPHPSHPTQFSFLLLGLPLCLYSWKKIDVTGKVSALLAFLLIAVSFLPTPCFGQYFCVAVPFLIFCLMSGMNRVLDLSRGKWKTFIQTGFLALAFFSAVAAVPRLYPLFVQGQGVPGVPAGFENDWAISTVSKISTDIKSAGGAGSLVVTSWPGYLIETDKRAYPKMENQISIGVSRKISPEDADLFRMLRIEDIAKAIEDRRTAVVVIGNCREWWGDSYLTALKDNGYNLYAKEGTANIYARNLND